MFNKTGDLFVKEIEKHVESGESFEMVDLIHRTTLDVIMRVSHQQTALYSKIISIQGLGY